MLPLSRVIRYRLAESAWGEDERKALLATLDSGRWTMGPEVEAFERELAAFVGARHAVMTTSGSMANLLAVAALAHRSERPARARGPQPRPIREGDEAVVPAIAWPTTYHPLHQHGLRLRVVDVDADTINVDFARLEAAINERTRLVVVADILGNPAPLERVRALCAERGIWLLEDCCESLGARLGGRACGTFGDIGTFSLFFSHQLSTIEGGAIVTDDDELGELARCLRAYGWARDLPPGSLVDSGAPEFPEAYRFVLPGYNGRPTELAAAVGRVQLRKLPAGLSARRANAARFRQAFAGDTRFRLQREEGESSFFGFTMIPRTSTRDEVLARLRAAGIEFRMITGGNILRHPVASRLRLAENLAPTPNADLAHERGFFVGNFARDASAELAWLRQALEGLK
jgi:CDP-6-deoxy-D-xylo-4-hexulose-3-dehydrase